MVDTSVIIIGVIILVVLAVITYIYWHLHGRAQHELIEYVAVLSGLALSLAFITILIQQQANINNSKQQQQQLLIGQEEKNYIDVISSFLPYYPYSYPLYKEMNSQVQTFLLLVELKI